MFDEPYKRAARIALGKVSAATPGFAKQFVPDALKRTILKAVARKDENEEPETYIVSYPKSGRTWLRVLLGKALADYSAASDRQAMSTKVLCRRAGIKPIQWTHDGSSPLDEQPYWALDEDKSKYHGKKVILLTRGLRDLIVSNYYGSSKRDQQFSGSMSEYIRSDVFGVRRILRFYNIWHEKQNVPARFLHLRYEDMHADPADILRHVLEEIEVPNIEHAALVAAVDFARFDSMKSLEQKDYFKSGSLRPRDPDDADSYKVRRGLVGGYRDQLSEQDLAYIEQAVAELGNPFAAGSPPVG